MLSKKYSLTSQKDFQLVYKKGKKVRGKYGMLIMYDPTPSVVKNPRFGFVISKKVGGAVARNKLRRQLRAITKEFLGSEKLEGKSFMFQYVVFECPEDFSKLKNEYMGQMKNLIA